MQSNPKRNYVMQWNFNIQRQLTPNTTLMVGYVGARVSICDFRRMTTTWFIPTPLIIPRALSHTRSMAMRNNNFSTVNANVAVTGAPYTIQMCNDKWELGPVSAAF